MAGPQSMSVAEAASKFLCGEQADVVREAVRTVVAELMEAEIAELVSAGRYERSPERAAQRNGYRQRGWDTRVAHWSWPSRACRPAATSRASWNRVTTASRPWWQWWLRPT